MFMNFAKFAILELNQKRVYNAGVMVTQVSILGFPDFEGLHFEAYLR